MMKGKTLFITGASRGIGKAIALRAASAGANIAVIGKTQEPHPNLPGTIYSAADEIVSAGGQALPLAADVRDAEQVEKAVAATVEQFGGIDILVNNASAIALNSTENIELKKYDLLQQVNARGTFVCSKLCIPHLKKSGNPHILTMSPPLNLQKGCFAKHTPYTLSKYGMSLCVMGLAAELERDRIAVNALWPKYLVATAATMMLAKSVPGIDIQRFLKPELVAEAAFQILCQPSAQATGKFYIDCEVLAAAGVTDLGIYANGSAFDPIPDLFL